MYTPVKSNRRLDPSVISLFRLYTLKGILRIVGENDNHGFVWFEVVFTGRTSPRSPLPQP